MNAPKVRLGELGKMIRGSGIRRNETVPEGLPCIRYGEIYTSYDVVLDRPRSFVPPSLYEKCPHIKKGDLVLALTGENKEEIAKSLAYLGEEEVAAGGDTAVWTGHGCDPLYLAYMMYSPKMIKAKADASNGHIVVHASVKKMQQIEVSLPPLSEQRKIAASVDKAMKRVDAIERQFEKLKERAESYFQSALNQCFTTLSSECKETATIDDICTFMTSGSRGWAKFYSASGDLFVTIKNVRRGVISTDNIQHVSPPCGAETERTRVHEGDLLISITADLGRTGVVDRAIAERCAYINQHLICIRLKQTIAVPLYVAYCIESSIGKRQIEIRNKDAVKAGLNFNRIKTIKIPLPSLQRQEEVVESLARSKRRGEVICELAARGLANCARMRKAILAEAFAV